MNLSIAKQKLSEEIAFLEKFFLDLHHSRFWRYVLVFFVIYLIAVAAILRADVQYDDDYVRSFSGLRSWDNWSRYLSTSLSAVVHGNTYLTDMAPMTQLLCLFFMSLASAIIVCVLTDQNQFRLMHIIAVLPLTISPYFLHCFSYRYDSPYMGLSVLASIFPFLFLNKSHTCFTVFSILGLLVMCMTYQAASGIYILMLLFWSLKTYLFDEKINTKKFLTILLLGGLAFITALGFYKIFLVHEVNTYVSTSISQSNFFETVLQNAKNYIKNLRSDLPSLWKYCIALIVLFCIGNITFATKKNRLTAFPITCLTTVAGLIISYGAYLALQNPLLHPRAMYGFGAWLALVSLLGILSCQKNLILNAFIILFSFWLIGYANLYGNALAEQVRYTNFRAQLILNDLNQIPSKSNKPDKIAITGTPVHSPNIKKWEKKYPVLARKIGLICYLSPYYWAKAIYLNYSFALPNTNVIRDAYKQYPKEKLKTLPIIFDRRYHTIYRDGEYIIINLK